MASFDPLATLRRLDGPVRPPESFSEPLYSGLRTQLDRKAVGALPESAASELEPRRGLLVAAAALASVLLMAGVLSWLAPADESTAPIEPLQLSAPEESRPTIVDHNQDPAVVSPTGGVPGAPRRRESPLTQNTGSYRFGGWQVLPVSAFDGRRGAAIVWTGEQLIVWGGTTPGAGPPPENGWPVASDGGIYDAAADAWFPLPSGPAGRSGATALWTGEEMLVIGGGAPGGAAYRPATRQWRPLLTHPLPAAPAAVWTGAEAVLWGGESPGAAYDPAGDSWRDIAPGPLTSRSEHAAVWTGTEMIVWGGLVDDAEAAAAGTGYSWSQDGAAYDPAADNWRQLSPAPDGLELSHPTAIWTGSEVIVVGHEAMDRDHEPTEDPAVAAAAFNPASDKWRVLATPRFSAIAQVDGFGVHSAVWAETRLVVWAGRDLLAATGPELWIYDPAEDAWERGASSPINADDPELVWTGETLFAIGGHAADPLERIMRMDVGSGGRFPPPVGTEVPMHLVPPLSFEMLAVAPDNRRVATIDFAAGLVTLYDGSESLLPTRMLDAAAPLADGWMTMAGGQLWWFPTGVARQPTVLAVFEADEWAPFAYAVPADGDVYADSIWTVQPGAGYGNFFEPSVVQLLSVVSGEVIASVEVPPDAAPVVASAAGLLLNHHDWIDIGDSFIPDPASRKMMLVEPDGTTKPLWRGIGIHLAGDTVVWLDCANPGAVCQLVATDIAEIDGRLEGIGHRVLADTAASYGASFQPGTSLVSPDGRWVVVERRPRDGTAASIDLVDLETFESRELRASGSLGSPVGPHMVWSADSEWLLILGERPTAIRIADGFSVDLWEWVPTDMEIFAVASRLPPPGGGSPPP